MKFIRETNDVPIGDYFRYNGEKSIWKRIEIPFIYKTINMNNVPWFRLIFKNDIIHMNIPIKGIRWLPRGQGGYILETLEDIEKEL